MNQRLAPLLIGGKERRPDIIIAHMAVSGPVQAVGSSGVAPGVAPPLSLLRPVCCHRKLPGRCFHVIKYRHAHSDTKKLTNGSFTGRWVSPKVQTDCGACRVGHVSNNRWTSPEGLLAALPVILL